MMRLQGWTVTGDGLRRAAPLMISALLLLFSVTRTVAAGAEFGVRFGRTDVKGDIFRGSGNPGGVNLVGVQINLPLAPLASVSLAGESKTRTLRFSEAGDVGHLFSGKGKWDDLALYATLRLHLIPVTAGPFSLYAGGGGGLHVTKVKFSDVAAVVDPNVNDFVTRAGKESTDFAWHLLGGASFGIPVLPLSAFAELRFEDVTGSFKPKSYTGLIGLNLKLP